MPVNSANPLVVSGPGAHRLTRCTRATTILPAPHPARNLWRSRGQQGRAAEGSHRPAKKKKARRSWFGSEEYTSYFPLSDFVNAPGCNTGTQKYNAFPTTESVGEKHHQRRAQQMYLTATVTGAELMQLTCGVTMRRGVGRKGAVPHYTKPQLLPETPGCTHTAPAWFNPNKRTERNRLPPEETARQKVK